MPIKELEKNITLLRDINEIYILKLIKEEGPISRAEISRRYNISRAAVSDIVSRLMQRDFICEIGEGCSSGKGGRKPVLLGFNEKAGCIVGVEIKKSYLRIALCDLNANILALNQHNIFGDESGEALLQIVCDQICHFMEKNNMSADRLLGIGVGIPGLVDFDQGILKEAHSTKPWNGIPIKNLFEKEFNTNVYVDNDIKLATIGEFIFGQGRKIKNMIFIGVGEGIGAGFIIDGQIYRGVTFSAGEIGYDELGYFLKEKKEFPLLFHGQRYFGDILSYRNVMQSFYLGLENGQKSLLSDMAIDQDKSLTPLHILESAERGDALCQKILKEYALLLGILSVKLINYLNPEMVVFNGEIFEHDGLVLETITDRIHRDILHLPLSKVKIRSSSTGRNSGVKGAVGLVLQDLFEPPLIDTRKYRTAFVQ